MSRFSPTVLPDSGPDFQSLLGEALGAIRQHQMDTQAKQDRQRQMERQAKQDAAAAEDRDYQRFGRERAMEQAGYTFDRPDPGPATPPPNIFAGQKFGMARRGPAMPPFVPSGGGLGGAMARRGPAMPPGTNGGNPLAQGLEGAGERPLSPPGAFDPATGTFTPPGYLRSAPAPKPVASIGGRGVYEIPGYQSPEQKAAGQRTELAKGLEKVLIERGVPPESVQSVAAMVASNPSMAKDLLVPKPGEDNSFSVHGRHFSDLGQALEAERAFADAGARQGLTPGEQLSAARLSDQRAERSREQTLSEAEGNAATWAGAGVPQGQISQFLRAQHHLTPGEANRLAAEAVAPRERAQSQRQETQRRDVIKNLPYPPRTRAQELAVEDLMDGYTPAEILDRLRRAQQAARQQGVDVRGSDLEEVRSYLEQYGAFEPIP